MLQTREARCRVRCVNDHVENWPMFDGANASDLFGREQPLKTNQPDEGQAHSQASRVSRTKRARLPGTAAGLHMDALS